ncbi:MAG TPA: hypothetical protein VEA60_15855, partial [Allosphingosinicella sp.]|nr:hypothetical protein [Allosphingosinicella sp.]
MSVSGNRAASEPRRFAALVGIAALGLAGAAIDGAVAQPAASSPSFPATVRGYSAPAAPAA